MIKKFIKVSRCLFGTQDLDYFPSTYDLLVALKLKQLGGQQNHMADSSQSHPLNYRLLTLDHHMMILAGLNMCMSAKPSVFLSQWSVTLQHKKTLQKIS